MWLQSITLSLWTEFFSQVSGFLAEYCRRVWQTLKIWFPFCRMVASNGLAFTFKLSERRIIVDNMLGFTCCMLSMMLFRQGVDSECMTTQAPQLSLCLPSLPTVHYTSQSTLSVQHRAQICNTRSHWSEGSKSPLQQPIRGGVTSAGPVWNLFSADERNLFPVLRQNGI